MTTRRRTGTTGGDEVLNLTWGDVDEASLAEELDQAVAVLADSLDGALVLNGSGAEVALDQFFEGRLTRLTRGVVPTLRNFDHAAV